MTNKMPTHPRRIANVLAMAEDARFTEDERRELAESKRTVAECKDALAEAERAQFALCERILARLEPN